jgi:hypothetical protein
MAAAQAVGTTYELIENILINTCNALDSEWDILELAMVSKPFFSVVNNSPAILHRLTASRFNTSWPFLDWNSRDWKVNLKRIIKWTPSNIEHEVIVLRKGQAEVMAVRSTIRSDSSAAPTFRLVDGDRVVVHFEPAELLTWDVHYVVDGVRLAKGRIEHPVVSLSSHAGIGLRVWDYMVSTHALRAWRDDAAVEMQWRLRAMSDQDLGDMVSRPQPRIFRAWRDCYWVDFAQDGHNSRHRNTAPQASSADVDELATKLLKALAVFIVGLLYVAVVLVGVDNKRVSAGTWWR